MIVPYSAGGQTDVIARNLAERMAAHPLLLGSNGWTGGTSPTMAPVVREEA
jgi:hypothetical protein